MIDWTEISVTAWYVNALCLRHTHKEMVKCKAEQDGEFSKSELCDVNQTPVETHKR